MRNQRLFEDLPIKRMMDDFFNTSLGDIIEYGQVSHPKTNIIENENGFEIHLVAPGMSKDDFQLELENNQLIVSAKTQEDDIKDERPKYYKREFSIRSFKPAFQVPVTIDEENIKASYGDGILKIDMPKKNVNENENKKKIEIA
jgi:HSP20 family protein